MNIEAAREELRNWRAWALDDPDHLGYPSRAAFARYYVAGKAFDETPPEAIDHEAAERTEEIVVAIGLEDFDAHLALVRAYLHGMGLKAMSKHFRKSVPATKSILRRAERIYCHMRG